MCNCTTYQNQYVVVAFYYTRVIIRIDACVILQYTRLLPGQPLNDECKCKSLLGHRRWLSLRC